MLRIVQYASGWWDKKLHVRNHTTVEVGVEDLVGSRTGQTQLQKQASPPDWFPLYRMRVGTEDSSRSDAHLAMFVSAHFFNQKS
jgi:hypothetical protein